MDPILHKVRQLVGMTGSSNLEEARSMALAACHMILKHDLVISLPAGAAVPASVTPNDHDFPFSPTVQGIPPSRHRAPVPAPAAPAPHAPKRTVKKKIDGPNGSVKLTSKYPGWCKGCGKAYSSGDVIYWRKDHGATHLKCGTKPLEK